MLGAMMLAHLAYVRPAAACSLPGLVEAALAAGRLGQLRQRARGRGRRVVAHEELRADLGRASLRHERAGEVLAVLAVEGLDEQRLENFVLTIVVVAEELWGVRGKAAGGCVSAWCLLVEVR